MAFCDQCGKEMREGAKFCDSCGVASGGGSEQSVAKQPGAGPVAARPSSSKTGEKRLKFILIAVVVVIGFCAVFWKHVPGLNTFIYKRRAPEGFAYIPPGQFMMGCSKGNKDCYDFEKPAHKVKITKGFYMKDTEVTQGEYESVMGKNPSHFKECGDDCPVEQVTWHDAKKYCEKTGGRLPTEAEWEYAARAGTITRYYWGNEMDGDYAWYNKNSDGKTQPYANKKPNAFGLYDMTGNVWEWVNDWWSENYYKNSPVKDPKGPDSGDYRVLRGGAFDARAVESRVSFRMGDIPGNPLSYFGFRCSQD
jgi:formylglycine-generating enzyme required for sulfatase activity